MSGRPRLFNLKGNRETVKVQGDAKASREVEHGLRVRVADGHQRANSQEELKMWKRDKSRTGEQTVSWEFQNELTYCNMSSIRSSLKMALP